MDNYIKILEQLKVTRAYILDTLRNVSYQDLNRIPTGFNNNIIWNLAHMVAAQQALCYSRAGVQFTIPEKYFSAFLPGTAPSADLSSEEIDEIKAIFVRSLEDFISDFSENKFEDYTEVNTRYGVTFSSVEDAISFLPFHEGMHTGTILSLKKVLGV